MLQTTLRASSTLLAAPHLNRSGQTTPNVMRLAAPSNQITSGKVNNPFKAVGQWLKDLLSSFTALFKTDSQEPSNLSTDSHSHHDHDDGHDHGDCCNNPDCPTHGKG